MEITIFIETASARQDKVVKIIVQCRGYDFAGNRQLIMSIINYYRIIFVSHIYKI